LVDPTVSAWEQLYVSGDNQAIITVCGFDHASFYQLEVLFTPYFDYYMPYSDDGYICPLNMPTQCIGHPRKCNARSCLALCLSWYHFRGPNYQLQGWFGFTGSPLSIWLRFAWAILTYVLSNHECRVTWPDNERVAIYQQVISAIYGNLHEAFSVGDGLKLIFEAAGDAIIQNMYYNGWLHCHCMTNLFLFAPDGTIIACILNVPSSIHDYTLAEWGGINDLLLQNYLNNGGRCIMDSAFAGRNHPGII